MLNEGYIKLALRLTIATMPSLAQCKFPADVTGRVLNYTFDATHTSTGGVLHVGLDFRTGQAVEELEIPTEWAGETLHGVRNLRAVSENTVISDGSSRESKVVRHPVNKEVLLAYDVVKDWTGPFRHPAEFHGTFLPEYLELAGDIALVRPKLPADATVTVHFDWRNLPTGWVLATSFGTSADSGERCQSYTGKWSAVQHALFAAGMFGIYHFRIGAQPAILSDPRPVDIFR